MSIETAAAANATRSARLAHDVQVRNHQTPLASNDDPTRAALRRLAARVIPGSLAEVAYLTAAGHYAAGRVVEAAFAAGYAEYLSV